MKDVVRINKAGLIEIANRANEKAVQPIARSVAGRVGGARVEVDRREGDDWAHYYVVAPAKRGFDGSLNRALGGPR